MATIKLTIAQKQYIESTFGRQDPKEIAVATGLTVRRVKSELRKLEEAGFKQQAPAPQSKNAAEQAGFAVHYGTDSEGKKNKVGSVVTTKSSSERADDHRKKNKNDEFYSRIDKNVHIIKPGQPTY